jgi:hypothetical protein
MASPQDLATIVAISLAIGVMGFVIMISVTIWGVRDIRRSQLTLQYAVHQGLAELQRGQAELKRLDIVIGGMVYQEDEKTRALIVARFDELMRQLPR